MTIRNKGIIQHIGLKSQISEILEFPADMLLSMPRLTLLGGETLVIENHRGVVEYSDNKIRLNTGYGVIAVEGEGMDLNHLSTDDILVRGRIIKIELK